MEKKAIKLMKFRRFKIIVVKYLPQNYSITYVIIKSHYKYRIS